jgi:hypothetical protein
MTFMAEAPASDETAVWDDDGAGGAVVGVSTAAPELAWSAAEADTELVDHRPWRLAWGHATVIAAIGVVVALVIGVAGWTTLRQREDRPAAPASPMAPLGGVLQDPRAPDGPPSPLPVVPDVKRKASPAQVYDTMLRAGGIITDQQYSDSDGRNGCNYVADHGQAALIDDIMAGRFGDGAAPTREQATMIVGALVRAYCPQLEGRS